MIAKLIALTIPMLWIVSFLYAAKKGVKIYDSFLNGVKKAPPLLLSLFPYIAAVTILTELLHESGVFQFLQTYTQPFFEKLGVPTEILPLVFLKPFSGSGSIAVLSDIFSRYGVDSAIARCACIAYGASDTTFYISAVYFAGIKRKSLPLAITISLFSYFCALLFGCWLCKYL